MATTAAGPTRTMTPISADGPVGSLPASLWTAREWILWGALAVALSASWVDLARHWLDEPWARPSAVFLPLFVIAAARDRGQPAVPRAGALLVAAGLAASLVAVAGGLPRLGRPGVPLAMIGMSLALGRPSLPAALLALWVIPPPFALAKLFSPGIEHALGWLAARVAESGGLEVVTTMRALVIDGAALELRPTDGGLPLVIQMAGVGWFAAVRAGDDVRGALATAVRWAPLGLAAQALALVAALGSLIAGAPGTARILLDGYPWPVLAVALAFASTRRAGGAGS